MNNICSNLAPKYIWSTDFIAYKMSPNGCTVHINLNTCRSFYIYNYKKCSGAYMEHIFRRKWFEDTIFCIAVVELDCTDIFSLFSDLKPEKATMIGNTY